MVQDSSRIPGRRISVIGATGSGKSYLSRLLAEALELPLHQLDAVRDAIPGGQADTAAFGRMVEEIAAGESWVIDGHYVAVRDLIWKRADTVILLDFPLWVVILQLAGRYLGKRRRGRDATPPTAQAASAGAPVRKAGSWKQRRDRILKTLRERREYGQILGNPSYCHLKIIELKSKAEVARWLRSIKG